MKTPAAKTVCFLFLLLILSVLLISCGSSESVDAKAETTTELVREMPVFDETTVPSTMETLVIDDLIETASAVKESKEAVSETTEAILRLLPEESAAPSEAATTAKQPATTKAATQPAETAKSTTARSTTAKQSTEKPATEKPATSKKPTAKSTTAAPVRSVSDAAYVLNTNTMKFHYPTCKSVKRIAPYNYAESNESRSEIIAKGYSPCGNCHP